MGGKNDALMWRLSSFWYGTSGIPDFDERYGGTRLCASQIGGGSGEVRYNVTPDLQFDARGYYVNSRSDFDGYDTPNFTLGNDNEYSRIDQFFGYAGFTLRSPDRTLTNRLDYQYTSTDTRNFDPNAPANEGSPSTETFYGVGRNQREEYLGTWAIGRAINWSSERSMNARPSIPIRRRSTTAAPIHAKLRHNRLGIRTASGRGCLASRSPPATATTGTTYMAATRPAICSSLELE